MLRRWLGAESKTERLQQANQLQVAIKADMAYETGNPSARASIMDIGRLPHLIQKAEVLRAIHK